MEHSKNEVIAKGQLAVLHGAHVHITGMWAWAKFDGKPNQETRDMLKAEGFRWASKKGMWYFAGKPRVGRKPMAWDYITYKYGDDQLNPA